jgi:hypothetical protein
MVVLLVGSVCATDWYGTYWDWNNDFFDNESTNGFQENNNPTIVDSNDMVGSGFLNISKTSDALYNDSGAMGWANSSTMDFWLYLVSSSTDDGIIALDTYPEMTLWLDGGGNLELLDNGALIDVGAYGTGAWRHVIVRWNTTGSEMWINNAKVGSGSAPTVSDWDRLYLGKDSLGGFSQIYMDNLFISENYYSTEMINESYNWGNGLEFGFETASIPTEYVEVNLIYPNNASINNTANFTYNISSSNSNIDNCSILLNGAINITNTSINNNTFNYFIKDLDDGNYNWSVSCFDVNGNSGNTTNRSLTIDNIYPLITPYGPLLNNNTIVYNGTLNTWLNFTDEREIYSILITLANGTVITNDTNLGLAFYQANISYGVDDTVSNSLTARICDSHTKAKIEPIKNNNRDKTLKFTIDEFLFVDTEWVKVYPSDKNGYDTPETEYQFDRQSFKFNKNSKMKYKESFIVESSHYIDIPSKQDFSGHLVIPEIGDNGYWIDFENDDTKDVKIRRISDTKIEVTITGLKGNSVEFHSIGELNCVEQTYPFANINPSYGYTPLVLVGDTVSIDLNISNDAVTMQSTTATLNYNGTLYTVDNANFSQNITAPSIPANTTFNWILEVDGINYTLPTYNQSIVDFGIDDCSTYSTLAINFTFLDENNQSPIFVDVTGVFNYTANGIKKSYTLSGTTTDQTQVCISPNYETFTGNYNLLYSAAIYPQRRYYVNSASYSNQSATIALYSLLSDEGLYKSFQVVDVGYNSLSGVEGIMSYTFNGSSKIVEQESTDDSGLATFFVDPDKDYQFTFSKAGYGSETFTLRPTSTEIYTVILGGSTGTQVNTSYAEGIEYSFSPKYDLVNNTHYTFNFDMDSNIWDITSCMLTLRDNASNSLNSSSSSYTTSNCNINVGYNVGSYTSILSYATYTLNNSDTLVVSKVYTVKDVYQGEGSLKTFIDDLRAFNEAGFNDFTRMFIAFIIIALMISVLSMKYGMTDPIPLIVITIFLVAFMSYIGWLTMTNLNYNGLASDWVKQYIIAILISLAGGSYILKDINN